MARPCRTCRHPKRKEIDVKLAAGAPLKATARQYDLPVSSLKNHKERHLAYLLGTNADTSGLRSVTLTTRKTSRRPTADAKKR